MSTKYSLLKTHIACNKNEMKAFTINEKLVRTLEDGGKEFIDVSNAY
jgi:hypothetical protein